MISINDLKRDLLEYNLYYLLDSVQYGDYQLTIINQNNKIIIAVYDDQGSAAWVMDKTEFLNIETTDELKKHIDAILYYNYIPMQ